MNNVTSTQRSDQIRLEAFIAAHRRKLGLPDNRLTKRVDVRAAR